MGQGGREGQNGYLHGASTSKFDVEAVPSNTDYDRDPEVRGAWATTNTCAQSRCRCQQAVSFAPVCGEQNWHCKASENRSATVLALHVCDEQWLR